MGNLVAILESAMSLAPMLSQIIDTVRGVADDQRTEVVSTEERHNVINIIAETGVVLPMILGLMPQIQKLLDGQGMSDDDLARLSQVADQIDAEIAKRLAAG